MDTIAVHSLPLRSWEDTNLVSLRVVHTIRIDDTGKKAAIRVSRDVFEVHMHLQAEKLSTVEDKLCDESGVGHR